MPSQNLSLSEIAYTRIDTYPNRPTIVFLHDSLGCIALWRDFPIKLGEITQCNVLIYDRQGYGKSCGFSYDQRENTYMEDEADILNDLLDFWKLDQVILFGHSDGGSIALLMAAKYPERVLGIITEGAHVFVEDITIKGIKEAIQLYETSDLKVKLEKYHGSNADAMFWAWATTWNKPDFISWNIEQFLLAIQCPSLIIQGEKDEYGTLKQVESILEQVNGRTQKYIIPEIGHTPHKETPVKVLLKTSTFIKTLF
ncbi:alpha/beta hydrolase [uncultured Flavobacterium sp.]|uniref:alpha/beta fold hydrolase n=1 Tax=uncultured Flavobacterium sp. TaxID=165435 RepID=UPI0030EDDDD5|tara:strand:+ start:12135 stop:12899 length:765 start_codon:yes stop_codon:yes gene_type:complete